MEEADEDKIVGIPHHFTNLMQIFPPVIAQKAAKD